MKKPLIFIIVASLSGLIGFSWNHFPLWRDVRFQTGFSDNVVLLPSGQEFKPGRWSNWPREASPVIEVSAPGSGARLLGQEGFEEPVMIRSRTGVYPAEITGVWISGSAKTWFIVPVLAD